MKIRTKGVSITIGSIYGPNHDNQLFFDTLKERITMLNSDFVVIGGDWNTTYDSRPSNQNQDVLNTVSIPSARRSAWLNQLCTECSITDPFRYFFPDTKEYTFVPFAAAANNRSRLDFFLITESLLSQCVNCRIPHSLSSLLFDHKSVFLQFNRFNPYKKQTIDDTILKDSDLSEIVSITALECYINHLTPSETLSDLEIGNFRTLIGRVLELQKELTSCKLKESENGFEQGNIDRIRHLRTTIKNTIDQLPDIETLQGYNLSCDRDVFLEILIMAVKNSSLAHQHDFFKIKNAKKTN
jgi:hypothetical protein